MQLDVLIRSKFLLVRKPSELLSKCLSKYQRLIGYCIAIYDIEGDIGNELIK